MGNNNSWLLKFVLLYLCTNILIWTIVHFFFIAAGKCCLVGHCKFIDFSWLFAYSWKITFFIWFLLSMWQYVVCFVARSRRPKESGRLHSAEQDKPDTVFHYHYLLWLHVSSWSFVSLRASWHWLSALSLYLARSSLSSVSSLANCCCTKKIVSGITFPKVQMSPFEL